MELYNSLQHQAQDYWAKRNSGSPDGKLLVKPWTRTPGEEAEARRIKVQAVLLGTAAGLASGQLNELALAALLHDIGEGKIPKKILTKDSPLSSEEREVIKKHPVIGHGIVMASTGRPEIAQAVLTHHERWDGNGYPLGLKGDEIPLLARIIAIVDAYDAMTHRRPYRPARAHGQALVEIAQGAGNQFDPRLVTIYLKLMGADWQQLQKAAD